MEVGANVFVFPYNTEGVVVRTRMLGIPIAPVIKCNVDGKLRSFQGQRAVDANLCLYYPLLYKNLPENEDEAAFRQKWRSTLANKQTLHQTLQEALDTKNASIIHNTWEWIKSVL